MNTNSPRRSTIQNGDAPGKRRSARWPSETCLWALLWHEKKTAAAAALLTATAALFQVAQVTVLKRLLDSVSFVRWNETVFFGVLLCGIYAFWYLEEPLLAYINSKLCVGLREPLETMDIEKAARISAAALEDPDNQALLARVMDAPENRYADGFFSVLQILGGALGTAGVFALLKDQLLFFLPVVIFLVGLMIPVFRRIGKYRTALYAARQETGRRGDYLSGLLFERRLAQEKKLFGYTPYIQKLYEEENIRSGRRLFRSIFAVNLTVWLYDNITYLFSASAYLLFLIPLYRGEMPVSLYIAVIPALTRLGNFFVAVGSRYLPACLEYRACLADRNRLNALPEQYYEPNEDIRKKDEKTPKFHVIRGENLVFRYPGQEKPVLDGLNFAFYAGKNYALVGENGCGKSTLIRLLMGFYQPQSGKITIDGEDINGMEFGRLQQYFSAVFQDFNRYDYTIRENICMSNLKEGNVEERMYQAAKETGLLDWIKSCPNGYESRLGNLEEGGTGLSGGQWQRLAIARMRFRKASIGIWDEPTAAMDPLAESRLYTDFLQKRAPDCANIFVTHRLGAAVSADEICVMENGRLTEQGNHAALMQREDGLYRRMFLAQKGLYE